MATASAGVYRPRHPEHTVLGRVLAQHFDRFVQVYEERFAPTRGPLPPGAPEAVNRYLDCGVFACGVARRLAAGVDPDEDNLSDAGVTNVPIQGGVRWRRDGTRPASAPKPHRAG